MSKRRFTYGQATEKSDVRDRNEDAALSVVLSGAAGFDDEDIGLFMVADGMGGKGLGKATAKTVINIIARDIMERLNSELIMQMEGQKPPFFSKTLDAAFQKANIAIFEPDPRKWNGGSTGTAALVVGKQIYVAHVGETKAYIVSDNHIEQLTRIHDSVHRLIELGIATWDEVNNPAATAYQNKLLRSFGMMETLDVDIITHSVNAGDTLLLCCDGIWARVEDSRIQEIILGYPDPQEACEQLIASANANQPFDNMTAILVKMMS